MHVINVGRVPGEAPQHPSPACMHMNILYMHPEGKLLLYLWNFNRVCTVLLHLCGLHSHGVVLSELILVGYLVYSMH